MKHMKKRTGIIAIILILAIITFLGWYTSGIIKGTLKRNSKGLKLGLDLAGGVSITYEAQGKKPTSQQLDDTVKKIQNRIENDLGSESSTTEANVYKVGDRRVTAEIPGVKDANALLEKLGTPGNLYFINPVASDGKTENYTLDSSGQYKLAKGVTIKSLKADGSIILSGSDVKTAKSGYQTDQTTKAQSPVVALTLTDKGAKAFGKATTTAAKATYGTIANTVGIYYDGKFVSVPRVDEPITGGNVQITGMSDIDEANQLASYIRIGGLDIDLKEIQSEVVGAQLGSDALKTSLLAAAVGLIIILIFMAIAYRVPGLAADLALILYTELTISILYLFDITLTLSGIAGIILSIGMAVDANAIIFTRIKEEIGKGHHVMSSIEEGFKNALSAIVDGNVTTLIAAAVLGIVGTGTIRGFAVTLALGVVLSMFTAFVITRLLVRSFYAAGVRNEKAYGIKEEKKPLPFIARRAIFFTISLAFIFTGIIGMGVYKARTGKALNYSLEFSGGTSTSVAANKSYTIKEIEKEIVPLVSEVTGDSNIQTQRVQKNNTLIIKTRTLNLKEREALEKTLEKNLNVTEKDIQSTNISSTISGEMRRNSIVAVLIAVAMMLVYIWFRFKDIRFGSSAVIALAHDVLVTLALYAVLRISVGTAFIACILTIIGYSINDTIVIFDRIRENIKAAPQSLKTEEGLRNLADKSITETLTRSLSTSFTTAVMVASLLIFGVSSIREFALPLLVGVTCGTYSSICIATELWYMMHKRLIGRTPVASKTSTKKGK